MTIASTDPGSYRRRGGLFEPAPWQASAAVNVGTALLLPLAVLLLWFAAVHFAWVSPLILPPPGMVVETAAGMFASGQIFSEVAISLGRIAAGLAIGGGLGIVLGIAMGRSETVEAYLGPTIRAIWLVPALGWLPFLMLFLGVGEGLKFAMIAKTCFMPLMVTAYEGTKAMPRRYLEVARVLELPRWTVLSKVIIPAALPSMFAGLRLAVSKGWQALVVVELIASSSGIGYLMNWGRKLFYLDIVIVTMIVIGIVGWLLDFLMQRVETRLTTWQTRSAG
ncbi:ABC transporter permease [Methylobrevis albus]|uniref:ABC transporter permease n=1 Tax=Methylobrevis albus TaxID=2793297 RepID=A0A931HYT8_9HYPH|nr:ABC transporter permease [Methylobrevis albus]MBH0236487.1 ABC transporter permease [Methylobrevis albus]